MANRYTDQQIADALAALTLNGGNVLATSQQLGIPRTSLIRWRDEALAACPDTVDSKLKPPPPPHNFASMWADVQEIAVTRALEMVPQLLPTSDGLKAVSVLAGIAADKYLDFTEGRKGAGNVVNVDARSITVEYVGDWRGRGSAAPEQSARHELAGEAENLRGFVDGGS